MFLKAWWHFSDNFGDAMTPYLVGSLSKKEVRYTEPWTYNGVDPIYMVTGSILGVNPAKDCVIWGNGIIHAKEPVFKAKRWAAVRGPLSAQRVVECGFPEPESLGDPAIVLPRIFNPTVAKKFKVGLTPNCVDYPLVKKWFEGSNIAIINLMNRNIEKVIVEILECETIVSSSLHGLVVAASYGIPTVWVKHSNAIVGDGTKYKDFILSIGLDAYEPAAISAATKAEDLIAMTKPHPVPPSLVDRLLATCPFKA